ncbi:MAG: isoprenylcysteine carboxylmethyltransferase family protein [Candidatus Levybacteria bacterium]|nr:isoprenylcysteine carboxylmethyltransferase family protein [Candidatus Levybacteria bacterium]
MIITFDFIFRVLTLLIFISWWGYWRITEKEADQQKPKTIAGSGLFTRNKVIRMITGAIQVVLILQLLGVSVLPIPGANVFMQIIGFLLVVTGVSVSVSARKTLGANWAHAAEFQIKKKQELVTSGVYTYIRHPIYAGLMLAFIGGELVVQSYYALAILPVIAGGLYQAKLEEKILVAHFGQAYKKYMKGSKMFIPYLW